MDLKETVQSFDIFNGLGAGELETILACGEQVHIGREKIVFEESSRETDIYILLNGRVSVELGYAYEADQHPHNLELALFRQGEVFGEIAFLRRSRRSARVTAIDDIEVLKLDGNRLLSRFEQDPSLGYRMMRNLACILAGRLETISLKHRDDIRS
ncbi:MAG: cyclic nucleotide-binding domain-containing protein [Desulfobacterales bacterium]|nr:cyclic nucleotide-binding domain-containing protein [Desulfobacterales bacterium]